MIKRRKPIARISKRRSKQLKEYKLLRDAFLEAHPYCQLASEIKQWLNGMENGPRSNRNYLASLLVTPQPRERSRRYIST